MVDRRAESHCGSQSAKRSVTASASYDDCACRISVGVIDNNYKPVAISGDDLVVETARLFGFDRTGPDLKDAIDRQAERLVREGRLHHDENGFRLSDGNSS